MADMSLDELHGYQRRRVGRQRVENLMFSLFWLGIMGIVFLSVVFAGDVETAALRASGFFMLCVAFLVFCISWRDRRRVQQLRLESTIIMKTLGEITSAYTWGEAIVVVGYDRTKINALAEFIWALPDVKHVAPAGVPPWLKDITKED